ncbi:MAG: site-specific tyrosine recombinase XerD [Bacteroidetes bacterium]|nr:site-specific tyrosine recombinase XerD [Bacteroidota bacterium]
MPSVKVLLNTYRKTKEGKHPLVIQLLHQRKKKIIFTPYQLSKNSFDQKNGLVRVRKNSFYSYEINQYLADSIFKFNCIISDLKDKNIDYSLDDILRIYQTNQSEGCMLSYMRTLILTMKKEGRMGTANAYQSALNCLERFLYPNNEILWGNITAGWVNKYVSYLKTLNLKANTINFYLRIIRAVYNKALSEGFAPANALSPFRNVVIRKAKTQKRAIDKDIIQIIYNADLSHDYNLEYVRDLFFFSFYCRGMPFVDMAHLKYANICNNTIYYSRHKTKQLLQIKIVAPVQSLINKYANSGEYIFPILGSDDKTSYKQYRNGLKHYNNNLKRLSSYLNLPVSLTSYIARHSWATIAKFSGAPVSVISEGLGHCSENVTYTYLASLDPSIVNNVNDMIIDSLFQR